MNLSCHFKEWSSQYACQLLKMKGMIQDVDGDCSLKLTGLCKGCPITAYYRLPLYALNKSSEFTERLWSTCGMPLELKLLQSKIPIFLWWNIYMIYALHSLMMLEDHHIWSMETSDQQYWTITFGWITSLMGSMMIVPRPCTQLMKLPSKASRMASVQIYLCFICNPVFPASLWL